VLHAYECRYLALYVKYKVKLTLCLIKHGAMKTYETVDVYLICNLGKLLASCPCRFTPGKKEPPVSIGWGSWMGPRGPPDLLEERTFLASA
jgi:hypothetical protein